MADKVVEQPEVAVEETEKDKKVVDEKVVEKKDECEKEVVEKEEENGKEATNGDSKPTEEDKCCIKRKSTGGDAAAEETPAEGATPEKKAKLDEPAEAESNGKAEVAA